MSCAAVWFHKPMKSSVVNRSENSPNIKTEWEQSAGLMMEKTQTLEVQ